MDDRCRCGEPVRAAYETWRCRMCRQACCPACADAETGLATCLSCMAASPAVTAVV